jgi:predicted NAD/FAD-dependent oxidoreductase
MNDGIAVIGAGLAGLTCARELQAAGRPVVVYDKGRRPGGRLASRRLEGSATASEWHALTDTGAQYFTVRDAEFASRVEQARRAGAVDEWRPRWPDDTRERTAMHVGVPGMNSLARTFAEGLDVRCATRIVAVERDGERWRLRDATASIDATFAAVVLAVPAPQAVEIARDHVDPRIAAVSLLPCWSVTLAFQRPLDVPLDADWRPHAVLPWIARDRSKPGRTGLDTWTLHASAEWSSAHLEASTDEVTAVLTETFAARLREALGRTVVLPPTEGRFAHRWRYARVDRPLGEEAWWDAARRIGACGDWCLDARVEAAFLSGRALAGRMLAR